MSVIVAGPLPDARDAQTGASTHLNAMLSELGLTAIGPTGNAPGLGGLRWLRQYQPRRPRLVYEPWSHGRTFLMRMPLIDGTDSARRQRPPAAMRYTESRLQALTTDSCSTTIEAETVDFIDTSTFQQEPRDARAAPPAC